MKKIFYEVAFATIMIVLIVPLIFIFIWAFTRSWPYPQILPSEFTLRGISQILDPKNNILSVLLFSVRLSSIVAFISILISIPAGKALAVYSFPGKNLFHMLVMSPFIIPAVSVAMGVHILMIRAGIANTVTGVILIHLATTVPYSIRIFIEIYNLIGDSYEVQGRVLGANPFQTFAYVTLPVLGEAISSAFSITFIVSFSHYFLTFIIGGGRVLTFPILMFPFIQSGDRTIGSVYSFAFILTGTLVIAIFDRVLSFRYKHLRKT